MCGVVGIVSQTSVNQSLFDMSDQQQRTLSVKRKLNPIRSEFNGKTILLVDDSIVRGTISQQVIQMARDAAARKVYFASAAPPVRYPNVYGIDMPTTGELIAHGHSEKEVERLIGADWLIYQDIGDLVACTSAGNPAITHFDCSIFDGRYITGDIDKDYLDNLAATRGALQNDDGTCGPADDTEPFPEGLHNYL